MDAKLSRALKISIGSVKRLVKEKALYAQEFQKAAGNVETSEFEPGSSDYKRLVNLREEAEQMIHDNESRLQEFKAKLAAALKPVENFAEDPLVIEAKQLLQ